MTKSADRPFDWIAALALGTGAIVVVASMAALASAGMAVVRAFL